MTKRLKKNPVFLKHVADGFLTVQSKKLEVEKVASDMNLEDKSAPLTPSDFSPEDEPKVN